MDARTRSLLRIGALTAVGAGPPSFRSEIDEAVSAGASLVEMVATLDALVDVVGMPRVVAAAQVIASAFATAEDVVCTDSG